MTLVKKVSLYLNVDENAVIQEAARAPTTYKRYTIPKASGGKRIIHQPSKITKAIQYAIVDILLRPLPVHSSAMAYVPGLASPLLTNATRHAPYKYSVRIDLKDFFPSIRPDDLLICLRQASVITGERDEELIKNALFVRYNAGHLGLAIGAPASPAICNVVMRALDTRFDAHAQTNCGAYSRYADDLVFSTNVKGTCSAFVEVVQSALSTTISPKLRLNEKKTIYMSRGTRRVVTGLYVTPDAKTSIGRANKRRLKALLHDYRRGRLNERQCNYLRGYLSFVCDVEPDFINALSLKYGALLVTAALTGRAVLKEAMAS